MKRPQRLREKCSSWTDWGKAERKPHRPSVPPPPQTPQLEKLRWGLGTEVQAPEVSPWERTRVGCVETVEELGSSAPWAGKQSPTAKGTREVV